MTSPAIGKPQEHSEDEDNSTESDVSSHVIAANDDLLSQILFRVPVKSLVRFKSVSKDWLSLIVSPQFRRLKSRQLCSRETSGLLLRRISSRFRPNPEYDFISLPGNRKQPHSPLERLDFVDDERGLDAVQFCNGLLLCKSSSCIASSRVVGDYASSRVVGNYAEQKYYVYNPTTKEYTTIPANHFEPGSGIIRRSCSVNLAFDPRKSPHYKVVFVYKLGLCDNCFGIYIYSSETGFVSHVDYSSHTTSCFLNGLYWNGAVNWIGHTSDGLYFNVDEERFGTLPMPPVPRWMAGTRYWEENGRWIRYFGESNDHLHLIFENRLTLTAQFNVYEMDKQYSGWFVRFRVDLEPVMRSFPESINHKLNPSHFKYYTFGILAVVRKDDDDDGRSFLVLSIPGKAIRYHFKDKIVAKMCDFDPLRDRHCSLPLYTWEDSTEFIESLHPL